MRLILVLSFLCLEAFSIPRINAIAPGQSTTAQAISSISEDFESGSKSSYGPADVQLSSGSWFFNNALIGSLSSDQKNGSRSVRIKGAGSIRMNFDFQGGASTVSIKHAVFGADQGSTWVLQISTDGGNSFNQVGNTITSSSTSLQEATFAINITGNIRIAIVKTDGGTSRINIDDVVINPLASGTGTSGLDNDNMLLGNPSHATADTDNFDNYLMVKEFYTLCYNRDKGKPDWVSWHLQASDLDSVDRSNDFRADITLPVSWFHVDEKSYTGSGFDRGHNCPSADRTLSREANSQTFLMTNMMPQAPRNNEQTWANLESYSRTLVKQGNELYIVAGSFGVGGTGKKGMMTTVANGHVTVPASTWKVIVVLPDGSNDLSRVTTSTRVIAVIMPNKNTIDTDWRKFRTSVRTIELATGYDLLSNVSLSIQQAIETKVDNQ